MLFRMKEKLRGYYDINGKYIFDEAQNSKNNMGDDSSPEMPTWGVVFQTKEQTHYFNCPYQLGTGSEDKVSFRISDKYQACHIYNFYQWTA